VIPPITGAIGPLGPAEWTIDPITSAGAGIPSTSATPASANSNGGFGGALSNAIQSLEQTQNNATTTSQALATGQLTDPTQAVAAIQNASLTMQFAAQVRNKLDDAATTIFQTQV
jgi:flagellar hook-basal body complex protein FliE